MTSARATRPRRRGLAAAAGIAALAGALCGAAPARAQFFYGDAVLSPRAVEWRLADQGYRPLMPPRYAGDAYVVHAINPLGWRVRLVVDARSGRILDRRPLALAPPPPPYAVYPAPVARAVPPGAGPNYGWTDDDASSAAPVPPAEIPGAAPKPAPRPRRTASREAAPPTLPTGAISGLNPDAPAPAARPAAPRARSARAADPATKPATKPIGAADAPSAPAPAPLPAAAKAAPPEPEAATAARDAAKPAEGTPWVDPKPARPSAPKADVPGTDVRKDGAAAPAESAPPRQVRVIDGVTAVPPRAADASAPKASEPAAN